MMANFIDSYVGLLERMRNKSRGKEYFSVYFYDTNHPIRVLV
jgi:hypothetical protein